MKERLSGQIATLDEKVSGLDQRLDIIEGRVNGLTGWLIGVLFAIERRDGISIDQFISTAILVFFPKSII